MMPKLPKQVDAKMDGGLVIVRIVIIYASPNITMLGFQLWFIQLQ